MLFFFNDTATTEIYTLSLHDALPIFHRAGRRVRRRAGSRSRRHRPAVPVAGRTRLRAERRSALARHGRRVGGRAADRSEEHTSELQSRQYLVCRLLLEKKNKIQYRII